ncbi:MAG: hypothetical protein IKU26_07515 [Clostridia bacterium]|nr:hypothetical protein [Clostridia bacterium]
MEINSWKSIFDTDTFVQTLAYAMPGEGACPGDGFMTGYGAVSGRLVFAAVQDLDYLGGAFGKVSASKIARSIEMAHKHGAPFVMFIKASGARLEEGLNILSGYGDILSALNKANDEIPTICVIEGNCFGVCATIAGLFDFVLMTKENSYASVLTKDGPVPENGASKCGEDGFATFVCKQEDLSATILHLLDFLPDNVQSGTEDYDGAQDNMNRPSVVCDQLQGSTDYNVQQILTEIADSGDWIELWKDYAAELIVGFARFGGKVVGVLANQPAVKEGALTIQACRKATAMIDFCDRFGIPLLTLTDCPGYFNNDKVPQGDLIQASSMLAQAFTGSSVPKLNVIVGRAYGSALLLMNSKQVGADYVYAWETAGINVITPEINVLLTEKEAIETADSPAAKRTELIEAYRKHACSPIVAAQQGFVDDIIPAVQTRARIISFYQMI